MIFFDCETCGLHGLPVLIQWAEDDGPIELYSPWSEPIFLTLQLIERFCEADAVCGFNLAFDWFQIQKLYTTLSLYHDDTELPMNIIEELAILEKEARDGPCVKPRSALDLMLHARKGPYQSTMARSDIRIRRVPSVLAHKLAEELEKRVPLPDIYFAKRADKNASQWSVRELDDEDDLATGFSDVVLSFNSSTALKFLAIDALKVPFEKIQFFDSIGVDEKLSPTEYGYAPFALAVGKPGAWNGAWPDVIIHHINHWRFHTRARQYASDDVVYTRGLYRHFGCPPHGDDDSILACMIASCRWKGYALDLEGIRKLRDATVNRMTVDGLKIPTTPEGARKWIEHAMTPIEKLGVAGQGFETSTKRSVLEDIRDNWKRDCDHIAIHGDLLVEANHPETCVCKGKGVVEHPSAKRAAMVLDARQAKYEQNLYEKFLLAERFHASYAIIGALSSRMGGGGTSKGIENSGKAGGDGMNPQGIKKAKPVRRQFPLAFPGEDLAGGDFDAFEVSIAEEVYHDENLRKELLTCERCSGRLVWVIGPTPVTQFFRDHGATQALEALARGERAGLDKETPTDGFLTNNFHCTSCGSSNGKKIHALFGVHVYPQHTYESLRATEGTANDLYTDCKRAVFGMMYGGTIYTLMNRLNVPEDVAKAAIAEFHRQFPGVKRSQVRIERMFGAISQLNGVGTKATYVEPADSITTMLGFTRYFTLENKIIKALFDLSSRLPADWHRITTRVQRCNRDKSRMQTASGATQSALLGAAFGLQSSNIRAAINHEIQSTGATITKDVQCRIWEIQPSGVHKWLVRPMNIHDEIECPHDPSVKQQLADTVSRAVESYRSKIPLIRMKWKHTCGTWADK